MVFFILFLYDYTFVCPQTPPLPFILNLPVTGIPLLYFNCTHVPLSLFH